MTTTTQVPEVGAEPVSTAELAAFVDRLSRLAPAAGDAERIEQLGLLETLKACAAAGQAKVAVAFEASQRAEQAAAGVPAARRGTGIASQIALARRESPNTGNRHLGMAKALVCEMPHTLAALATGALNEWRATLLVRETAHLRLEHRMLIDEQLCADPTTLHGIGDAGIVIAAKKLAYRLDPAAAVRRAAKAHTDRRVSVRPAPDTMTYVTGLLPVADGVAIHAALTAHADTCKAQGDSRTRGQIMADTFTARLTGNDSAKPGAIELQLVMTDTTVFGTTPTPSNGDGGDPVDEPARLTAPGLRGDLLPAALARQLLRDAHRVWIRRLFRHPDSGELVAMDSRRRLFDTKLRQQIIIRDQICRTPWCDAPIRHTDHITPHQTGGATSELNGQGLCEACNHTKQAPGWSHIRTRQGGRHRVDITTPTGHTYRSHAPPMPGHPPRASTLSVMEQHFETYLRRAS